MESVQVLGYYILWHYTKAWKDIARIVGNYLWFTVNFFSIGLLFKTLLSPWRRLNVSSGRHGEESMFGAFVINTLMRLIGFFARLFVIVAGIISCAAVIAGGLALLVIWLLLPVIIFFSLFIGVGYLLNGFK